VEEQKTCSKSASEGLGWNWQGKQVRWVLWGGDHKVRKMTGHARRFPPQLLHCHSALRLDSPFPPRPCLTRFFASSHACQLPVDLELCPVNDYCCLRIPRPGHSRGVVKVTRPVLNIQITSPPDPRSPKRPNKINFRTDLRLSPD
jgi:hypothetical protein